MDIIVSPVVPGPVSPVETSRTRRSRDFALMLTEAAEQLDTTEAIKQNLISQTAAMNILAARTSTAMNPAIISYASQLANQVNLESGMPLHRPLRQSFGDRFGERDRADGHVRVPPANETQSGPEVL